MPCDHVDPKDVIELAEGALRDRGLSEERWSGAKFRHGENPQRAMWASVVIEVERRGGQWVVTRLDRNKEPIPESETGLQMIVPPAC
jgi:hypothetical protein